MSRMAFDQADAEDPMEALEMDQGGGVGGGCEAWAERPTWNWMAQTEPDGDGGGEGTGWSELEEAITLREENHGAPGQEDGEKVDAHRAKMKLDELVSLTEGGRRPSAMVAWESDFNFEGALGPSIQEERDSAEEKEHENVTLDSFSRELAEQAKYMKVKWKQAAEAYERARIALDRAPRPGDQGSRGGAWKGGPMHAARVVQQEDLPLEPRVEEEGAQDGVGDSQSMRHEVKYVEGSRNKKQAERSSERAVKTTRRGKRGKQGRQVEIWTFNGSGAPQLKAAIAHAAHQVRSPPIAICAQEHHSTKDRLPDLQAAAGAVGWKIAAAKAVTTPEGGVSAGAAVCNPSSVATGRDEKTPWDWSPAQSRGRIAAIWVQELIPCGFMAVSCYMYTAEGATERNVQILAKALEGVKAARCPWVMGLDAQQEPEQFLRWAAPMIEKAGGTVVAPKEPTHVPGRGTCQSH